MNHPHRRDHNSVPLGRRVAELRVNRGMSQQAFADRLGKSKSWVDKVERGVRKLDTTRGTRSLLVSTYRITAAVLIKLDHAELAWLAADRAVTAAAEGPTLTAAATIGITQALRALDHHHLAVTAAITAADTADDDNVRATLYLQAALATASYGDRRNTHDLLDYAASLAGRRANDTDPQHTGFGSGAVESARFLAAHCLGDTAEALHRHEHAIRSHGWRRLPPEHRGAHLIDAARAYLDTGDPAQAGQALLDADRIAPAEVRNRSVARTLLAEIIHRGPAAADVARLATILGLTR
ncbi:hypothetical protein C1I93_04160 [Micromonospora endophytica]|uniref:HTH cro/C1-type domain-containing protein n=1 Tax=Micromonospora endophytica TaxID=515350 RepID=A0A2W2E4P8_9ACTN|nr:hypothetical protein C1I93_04160 [Micromonospora endophytica]RIW49512.1 XRE family transcriptional regulator [Micromonospora endophytica]